ncbi:hypothetical protein B0H19DRAFT_1062546 [Mycena capillaripes]|nr:hypothetical protein B0H19DRAFT_1062546 [Mycena capillaripes]
MAQIHLRRTPSSRTKFEIPSDGGGKMELWLDPRTLADLPTSSTYSTRHASLRRGAVSDPVAALHPAPQLRVPQTPIFPSPLRSLVPSFSFLLSPPSTPDHFSTVFSSVLKIDARARTTFEEPAAGATRVDEWCIAAGRVRVSLSSSVSFPRFHLSAFSSLVLVFSPPRMPWVYPYNDASIALRAPVTTPTTPGESFTTPMATYTRLRAPRRRPSRRRTPGREFVTRPVSAAGASSVTPQNDAAHTRFPLTAPYAILRRRHPTLRFSGHALMQRERAVERITQSLAITSMNGSDRNTFCKMWEPPRKVVDGDGANPKSALLRNSGFVVTAAVRVERAVAHIILTRQL